jgi:steroid delta-isomerase-like uncharacterized protein
VPDNEESVMSIRRVLFSMVMAGAVVVGSVHSCTGLVQAADTGAINKTAARRVYEEGLSRGKFDVQYTDDFVGHGGAATFTHADGMAEARGWRKAFPDLQVDVDLIVAERDLVAVRWTAHGTNTGEGNGIPATGKQVKVSGQTIFRFVDGKIAEEWTSGDTLGLMKQLGLLPKPAPTASATSSSGSARNAAAATPAPVQ